MVDRTRNVSDFIALFKRRLIPFLVALGLLLLASLIFTVVLPPIYQSSATILIEQQEVPQDLVRSTITSYADQRIQSIRQRVMTHTNLLGIINEHQLYARRRAREPNEVLVERMRDHIDLEIVSADVLDPQSGRPIEATIAFRVSFKDRSPVLARNVANELTNLFLNENLRSRRERTEETVEFLSDEANKLANGLRDLDAQIATFEEQYAYNLPEYTAFNISQLESTEKDIKDTEDAIQQGEAQRLSLQQNLEQFRQGFGTTTNEAEIALSPWATLRFSKTQLMALSQRYTDSHPDVQRLRREVSGLQGIVGETDNNGALNQELNILQTQLVQARQRYSAEHPQVKSLERMVVGLERELQTNGYPTTFEGREIHDQLAILEQQLAVAEERYQPSHPEVVELRQLIDALGNELRANGISIGSNDSFGDEPNDPNYLSAKLELQLTETRLDTLRERLGELRQRRDTFAERIALAPVVGRELKSLERTYANELVKFQEIKAKQLEAEIAQALEDENKSERFEIIEQPLLPEKPDSPNRILILFLTVGLSIGISVIGVIIADNYDNTILAPREITALINVPPLAVVPHISTEAELLARAKRKKTFLIVATVSIITVVILIHFLYRPLDDLWFSLMRRMS